MDGYSRLPRSAERGSVLVSALAFALVISLALAGAAAFTVAHMSQVATEADYASAMNLAEAGANWELRKLATTSATTDTSASPGVGNVSYPSASGTVTMPGSFSVYVTNDPDNGQPWVAPRRALVWSTGTINGVSRTIRVSAYRKSLFNQFAIYGISTIANTGNFIIEGAIGSNGPITNKGTSNVIYGDVNFYGYPTGSYTGVLGWIDGGFSPAYGPYGIVQHQPDPLPWPTVSQIADKAAADKSGTAISAGAGLAWFKANNDNIRADGKGIQVFTATDVNNSTDPTTRSTVQIAQNKIQTGGIWVLPSGAGVSNSNVMDRPGTAIKRYIFQAEAGGDVWFNYVNPTNSIRIAANGLYGQRVVILPGSGSSTVYRDYYFENITMGGADAVLVDTASGPIRIWLDAPDGSYGTKADALGQFIFTTNTTTQPIVSPGTDPSRFRLYDNKGVKQGGGVAGDLQFSGNCYFPGGVYVYNGSGYSTVGMSGTTVIYGSAIASIFTGGGGPLVKFPPAAIRNDDPNDWSISWGFLGGAVELGGAN